MQQSNSSPGNLRYREHNSTAMFRLANRLWEYPPRAPPLPPPRPVLSSSLRTRVWMHPQLLSLLQRRSEDLDLDTTSQTAPTGTSYIHSLPPEVLIEILCLVTALETSANAVNISSTRGILKLMLVCSYWRALVLDTSTLWRQIHSAHDPSWVALCLERSRGCLLDVQICLPGERCSAVIRLITPHAWRIRSFRAFLEWPASKSEVLGVLTEAGAVQQRSMGSLEPTAEPQLCPCLRILILERVDLVLPEPLWRSLHLLRSLRVLRLTFMVGGSRRESEIALALPGLMQMIAHNPLLETLALHCYSYGYFLAISAETLQTSLRDAQTSLTEMFLPHLDTLTIHGTHAFVSTFSEHLNIPEDIPNVDIRVQVESTPTDAVVDPAITAFSLPRPLRPMLQRMTDIKLVGIFGSRAQISSPRPPWPARPADLHRQLSFSLEGYPPYPSTVSRHTNTLQTNLSRLALMLAPVAVRKLAINVSLARLRRHYGGIVNAPSESAANAFWGTLLNCFPSVEELCILVPPAGLNAVRVDLLSVLQVLRPQPQPSLSQQPGVDDQNAAGARQGELELPRCPLLTRLSIHGQIGFDAGELEEALGPLVDCVVDRARASARLGLLDLHFWYWKQSEMEPLGEARRATLERAKDYVGYFQCKFGRSAGCRGCR